MAIVLIGEITGVVQVRESTQTVPLRQISIGGVTGDTDAKDEGTRVVTSGTSIFTLWDASDANTQPDTVAHMIYIRAISTVTKAPRSIQITLTNNEGTPQSMIIDITELSLFVKENANITKIQVLVQAAGDATEIEHIILGV